MRPPILSTSPARLTHRLLHRVLVGGVLGPAVLASGLAAAGQVAEVGKVEPAVWEAVQEEGGEVYVVVELRSVAPRPREELGLVQAEVAARQAEVLASLEPGDLRIGYRYRNVAGLTGWATARGVARLAAHSEVVGVGVDLRGEGQSTQSLQYINGDDVHALGFTGQGVDVAVLDTGIDTDHPDLLDDLAPGAWTFLDQGATSLAGAEDDHGHGSHVSGIITSQGTVGGMLGVAPDARIVPIKVLDANNTGWLSDWTAGVDHAVTLAATSSSLRLLNLSLVTSLVVSACPGDDVGPQFSLHASALEVARAAGLTIFAAAGNGGYCGLMPMPAAASASVPVATVYEQVLPGPFTWAACTDGAVVPDQVSCYSNLGMCAMLAAPGNGIVAPDIGGGTATRSGTSMASPHAAGVAALLLEADPTLQPAGIAQLLVETGHPTTTLCAVGPTPSRIDALAALNGLPSAQDCDGNGVPDGQDIASGTHPDCDGNGVPDPCDLASGALVDLDGDGQLDACVQPPFSANKTALSVTMGGTQVFDLLTAHPSQLYVVVGSVSGTQPGTPFGGWTVPLNLDGYMIHTLTQPNQPPLALSFGLLNPAGGHLAAFSLAPGFAAGLVGLQVNHAFVVLDPVGGAVLQVSNPVPLDLWP